MHAPMRAGGSDGADASYSGYYGGGASAGLRSGGDDGADGQVLLWSLGLPSR